MNNCSIKKPVGDKLAIMFYECLLIPWTYSISQKIQNPNKLNTKNKAGDVEKVKEKVKVTLEDDQKHRNSPISPVRTAVHVHSYSQLLIPWVFNKIWKKIRNPKQESKKQSWWGWESDPEMMKSTDNCLTCSHCCPVMVKPFVRLHVWAPRAITTQKHRRQK